MKYQIILGAGISGLSVASKLVEDPDNKVIIVEQNNMAGGASGSFEHGGCVLDYGPHKFFPQTQLAEDTLLKLAGDDIATVIKESSIRLQGRFFKYPFRMTELIMGLKKTTAVMAVLLYIKEKLKKHTAPPANYEEAIIRSFGKGLYELVFSSQANKIWGDPKTLEAELANLRVPSSGLLSLIIQIITRKDEINGRKVNAASYYYPKMGIGEIPEKFRTHIINRGGEIWTSSSVKSISIDNGVISSIIICKNGQAHEFCPANVVSTIPIDELTGLMRPLPSSRVLNAAANLEYRGSMIVYFTVNRPKVMSDQWIFFPEAEFTFNRLYEQKQFSAHTVPFEDRTIIGVDFNLKPDEELWNSSESKLRDILIPELEKTGLVCADEISEVFVRKFRKIYPVYKLGYKNNLDTLLEFESRIGNLFTAGRLGQFNYNNMDHCIDMGIRLGTKITEGCPKSEFWAREKEYYRQYRIVD